MNWLKSLLEHNHAWLVAVAGSMATAAAASLATTGKISQPLVAAAGLGALGAALTKSPIPQTPAGAAQATVAAIAGQAAADIEAGDPVGTQVIVDAAKQVAQDAIRKTPPNP